MIRQFILRGHMVGGKNSIGTAYTPDGRKIRYPSKPFQRWKALMLPQVYAQKQIISVLYRVPVWFKADYFPADLRNHDMDGMIGALFHLMEFAKVVEDDKLFKESRGWKEWPVDRVNPRVVFDIGEII